MNAYRKLSKKEYLEVHRSFRCINARFWHAADENQWPQRRIHNSYRRAVVTRLGDTLCFFAAGECWIIPENEYRFIEGDVNTDTTDLDFYGRKRYEDAAAWCLKHGCEVWELDGFERCPGSVLKVGFDAQMPTNEQEVTEEAPTITQDSTKQAEIQPMVAASEPKCAPLASEVADVSKPSEDGPRRGAKSTRKRKSAKETAAHAKNEQPESHERIVDPYPTDTSGWKGTRKRRSCVSKRNTHESMVGCMAIGAMFARKG